MSSASQEVSENSGFSDTDHQQKISTATVSLALVDIEVIDRLRPTDSDWVDALAGTMAEKGLLQDIEVSRLPGQKGFRLVIGAHRLEAARRLGWTHINAKVVNGDKAERRAREIIENVFRRDLGPIDRAAFVAELYQLEKARAGLDADADGRAHSAKVKWGLKEEADDARVNITRAYSMRDEVAAKIGMSVESVKKDLLLFKRLAPSIVARVRVLPIADNAAALRKLAGLEVERQSKVLDHIEAGRAKGVNDALDIIIRKVPPSAEQKRRDTFLSTWGRMGAAERKTALRELANQAMPQGYAVVCPVKPARDLSQDEKAHHAEIMKMVRGAGDDMTGKVAAE